MLVKIIRADPGLVDNVPHWHVLGDTSNTELCALTAKSSLKVIFIISSVYDACIYTYYGSFYECLHIYLFFLKWF